MIGLTLETTRRLGFARKKLGAEMTSQELHPSWQNRQNSANVVNGSEALGIDC
jgi:hypothetical protein